MKEREIRVTTNVAGIVPEEGQQLSVNGQLTPLPSADVIRIQDALGRRVLIPSNEVMAAITRQSVAETPVSSVGLSNAGSTGEPINDAPISSETPSQYETTIE
jgi:hypothetical protein